MIVVLWIVVVEALREVGVIEGNRLSLRRLRLLRAVLGARLGLQRLAFCGLVLLGVLLRVGAATMGFAAADGVGVCSTRLLCLHGLVRLGCAATR